MHIQKLKGRIEKKVRGIESLTAAKLKEDELSDEDEEDEDENKEE